MIVWAESVVMVNSCLMVCISEAMSKVVCVVVIVHLMAPSVVIAIVAPSVLTVCELVSEGGCNLVMWGCIVRCLMVWCVVMWGCEVRCLMVWCAMLCLLDKVRERGIVWDLRVMIWRNISSVVLKNRCVIHWGTVIQWSFVCVMHWRTHMMDIVMDIVMDFVIMTSIFDLFRMWGSSCGNWQIDVFGPVGDWLIVGMVGDGSHWFPVDVHLLVVNRLILRFRSVIFVLWLWSVMDRSLIVVVFRDVGLWLGHSVVMTIDQMWFFMVIFMMYGRNVIVLFCVAILGMGSFMDIVDIMIAVCMPVIVMVTV